MKKLLLTVLLAGSFGHLWAILPDTTYVRMPEALGLIYKDLDVTTPDGYHLSTWFFPAQEALSEEAQTALQGQKVPYRLLDSVPRPTIIICNGDAGNMSYFQLHLAYAYTAQYNVVTFDWRGFGHSSPFAMEPDYLCYTEMLTDYAAVVDYVAAMPEVDAEKIIVMGWSTGAYLSMITAQRHANIAGFIGRSLCTDFADFIPLVMAKRNKTIDQLLIPADFPTQEMPIHIAPAFRKPTFLIVGENDFRTPVWMSQKVLEAMPKDVPTELMIVPNAGHGGKEDPIMIAFPEFIQRTTAFIENNL